MSSKFGILMCEAWPGLTDRLGSSATIKFKQLIPTLKLGKLSMVTFERQALFSKEKPRVTKLSDQTDFLSGQHCPCTNK